MTPRKGKTVQGHQLRLILIHVEINTLDVRYAHAVQLHSTAVVLYIPEAQGRPADASAAFLSPRRTPSQVQRKSFQSFPSFELPTQADNEVHLQKSHASFRTTSSTYLCLAAGAHLRGLHVSHHGEGPHKRREYFAQLGGCASSYLNDPSTDFVFLRVLLTRN